MTKSEDEFHQFESSRPISESKLWEYQHLYFLTEGPEVAEWDGKEKLNSGSVIRAKQYVQLVFGLCRDLHRQGITSNQPLYLIELGAGSGRDAFHFLSLWTECSNYATFPLPTIKYVLTDIGENHLTYWEQHPRLIPFFEQGLLDMAIFDIKKREVFNLLISDKILTAENLDYPIFFFANKVMSCLPQDVFYINEDQCQISLLGLESDIKLEGEYTAAETLRSLRPKISYATFESTAWEDQHLDTLLQLYKKNYDSAYVPFPHIMMKLMTFLKGLSPLGALIAFSDVGFQKDEGLEGSAFPSVVRDGYFSMPINYHVMHRYCDLLNGSAYFDPKDSVNATWGYFNLCKETLNWKETQLSFLHTLGLQNRFQLLQTTQTDDAVNSLRNIDNIIIQLRASEYDARELFSNLNYIHEQFEEITISERADLRSTILRTWELHFPLLKGPDLAFEFAIILYKLGYFADALKLFKESSYLYGETESVLSNISLCKDKL